LTACEDDKSVEEARADLCDDLEAFRTATQALAAIDANSTVGELRDAQEDVASAWDDVQSSVADVDDAEIEDLEAAYDALEETLDGIDDDAVISDAVADIESDLEAVDAAWQEVVTVTPCEGAAEATETPESTATEEDEETAEATEEAGTETPEADETAEPTEDASVTEAPATSEPTVEPTAEATATP
jgi:hypothetical protein